MPSAGRVGAYGIRPHKWPVRGKFMTSDFRSGAPVPCWYVLGRMQFAPTLTADNSPHASAAPVGNHFENLGHPSASAAYSGEGDFMSIASAEKQFVNSGHKPAPVGNHFANLGYPSAPIGKHFTNPRRTVASIKNPLGNLFHDHAHVEAFNEALFCDHTLIEVFNGA